MCFNSPKRTETACFQDSRFQNPLETVLDIRLHLGKRSLLPAAFQMSVLMADTKKSPICTSSEWATRVSVCVRVWQEIGASSPFIFYTLWQRSALSALAPHTSPHQSASKTSFFFSLQFSRLVFPTFSLKMSIKPSFCCCCSLLWIHLHRLHFLFGWFPPAFLCRFQSLISL